MKKEDIKLERVRNYLAKHNVPVHPKIIKYISGIDEFDINIERKKNRYAPELQKYYFWKNGEEIIILSKPDDIRNRVLIQNKIALDINKINYYTIQGDRYVTTDVQGGGASLGKALIGGVIAGGAGAVIASREKITSNTNVVDERNTMISYNENGIDINIILSSDAYNYLLKWIPNKEYQFVINSETKLNKNDKNETKSLLNEIKELVKLKEMGMLNEEEFNLMKKEILGL
ncbi:MAG: hypothetical protein Q3980_12685 [Turicibacter sp.]|nr:hypothetical protein [Turicibacter sp.]